MQKIFLKFINAIFFLLSTKHIPKIKGLPFANDDMQPANQNKRKQRLFDGFFFGCKFEWSALYSRKSTQIRSFFFCSGEAYFLSAPRISERSVTFIPHEHSSYQNVMCKEYGFYVKVFSFHTHFFLLNKI